MGRKLFEGEFETLDELAEDDIVLLDGPECVWCKHAHSSVENFPFEKATCDAFPGGIPDDLLREIKQEGQICNKNIGFRRNY